MENLCDGQVEGGSAGTAGSFCCLFYFFIYAPLELYVTNQTEFWFQTVDKTLLVSTPEAFFLFWVQKVCT